MTPSRQRATDVVLCAAAAAWPLEVFAQLPMFGIHLIWALAVVLALVLAPQAIADRKIHVPFEVWFPAAVLIAASLASGWPRPSDRDWDLLAMVLIFLCVIEAAPSPDVSRRYLMLSAVSAGVVVLTSLLAPRMGFFPTAFSFRSAVTFTFAYDLPGGVLALLLGAAFAAGVAAKKEFSPVQRATASAVLLLVGILLVGRSILWFRDTGVIPSVPYPSLDAAGWIVGAVALWWVARVLAKIEVHRRRAGSETARLWWACALATLAVAAFAPILPRPYHGLLLGLAGASALPVRLHIRQPRATFLAAFVVAVLFTVNLLIVFPENTSDPRQYDAAASREFPRVFERMDWVDRHAGGERRTDLWRARAALEYQLPNVASFAFARAVSAPEHRMVLPPPSEYERQAFLVDIRDVTAALPDDRASCAYERVLLALNERDTALHSLRLQLRGQDQGDRFHVPTADAVPFAGIAGLVSGDPLLAEDMRAWTADEVVSLLIRWGADAAFAAEGPDAARGLFILAAQRGWDTLSILVRNGEQVTRIDEPLNPPTQRDIEVLEGTRIMAWSNPISTPDGGLRYMLNVAGEGGVVSAAYVDLRTDAPARFSWAKPAPAVPFTPAMRIRVSR